MIWITGDCHRNFEKFNISNFSEQADMAKDDYIIICGDFGGVWDENSESMEETMLLDWLDCKPYTTLFVSGNHENFDRLKGYPVEEWNGGKIQRIRPSVIHLMRGQVFVLEGKTFFTFGGAKSHDMVCVLDREDPDFRKKKRELKREWIPYRTNHVDWWQEELPTTEEMEEGLRNLEIHDWNVDYIVTHCCSSSTQAMIGDETFKSDLLTDYFEKVKQNTVYKKWYFGHYHMDQELFGCENVLCDKIIRII